MKEPKEMIYTNRKQKGGERWSKQEKNNHKPWVVRSRQWKAGHETIAAGGFLPAVGVLMLNTPIEICLFRGISRLHDHSYRTSHRRQVAGARASEGWEGGSDLNSKFYSPPISVEPLPNLSLSSLSS